MLALPAGGSRAYSSDWSENAERVSGKRVSKMPWIWWLLTLNAENQRS